MTCPNCGGGNPPESNCCSYCGTKLSGNNNYQQTYASQPNPTGQPYPAGQPYYVNQSNPAYGSTIYSKPISPSNRWVAFALCFVLGVIGIHRFYVGKIGTGVLYIFTGGLFGIGWLVDLIMIACGSFTDKAGLPLKQ